MRNAIRAYSYLTQLSFLRSSLDVIFPPISFSVITRMQWKYFSPIRQNDVVVVGRVIYFLISISMISIFNGCMELSEQSSGAEFIPFHCKIYGNFFFFRIKTWERNMRNNQPKMNACKYVEDVLRTKLGVRINVYKAKNECYSRERDCEIYCFYCISLPFEGFQT